MTKLLQPSVKVIGYYPSSPFKTGDELICQGEYYVSNTGVEILQKEVRLCYQSHVNLFQFINWWEILDVSQFPEYLRSASDFADMGWVFSYYAIHKYSVSDVNGCWMARYGEHWSNSIQIDSRCSRIEPISKEDYEKYKHLHRKVIK